MKSTEQRDERETCDVARCDDSYPTAICTSNKLLLEEVRYLRTITSESVIHAGNVS